MPFTLPNFNLLMNVWRNPRVPASGGPDVANLACQLYLNTRGTFDLLPGARAQWVPPVWLRIAPGVFLAAPNDLYEVVAGGTRYYLYRWDERTHLGFPNAYDSILVEQCTIARGTPRN